MTLVIILAELINMKIRLIILLLTLANVCFSQEGSTLDNKISIKTSPLSIIDVYGGYSYRIGAEFKISGNVATSIECGKYFSFGKGSKLNLKLNTKGFIVKPELKVYLNKTQKTNGEFVSLEFLYKKITFDYKDSIRIIPNPSYEKQYTIFKDIYCLTFKYGKLKVYESKFIFEWYVGAGIRFLNGHNSLSKEENDGVLTGENHGDLIADGQRAINHVYPNFSAGFKIGYLIK